MPIELVLFYSRQYMFKVGDAEHVLENKMIKEVKRYQKDVHGEFGFAICTLSTPIESQCPLKYYCRNFN